MWGSEERRQDVPRRTIVGLVVMASLCGLVSMAAAPASDITGDIVALERQAMDGWLKGNPEPMLARMDPQVTYIHEVTQKRLEGHRRRAAALRAIPRPAVVRPLRDRRPTGANDGRRERGRAELPTRHPQRLEHRTVEHDPGERADQRGRVAGHPRARLAGCLLAGDPAIVRQSRGRSRIEHGWSPEMALRWGWVVVKAPGRWPLGAIQEGDERPGLCAAAFRVWSCGNPGSEPMARPGGGFGLRASMRLGPSADSRATSVLYADVLPLACPDPMRWRSERGPFVRASRGHNTGTLLDTHGRS